MHLSCTTSGEPRIPCALVCGKDPQSVHGSQAAGDTFLRRRLSCRPGPSRQGSPGLAPLAAHVPVTRSSAEAQCRPVGCSATGSPVPCVWNVPWPSVASSCPDTSAPQGLSTCDAILWAVIPVCPVPGMCTVTMPQRPFPAPVWTRVLLPLAAGGRSVELAAVPHTAPSFWHILASCTDVPSPSGTLYRRQESAFLQEPGCSRRGGSGHWVLAALGHSCSGPRRAEPAPRILGPLSVSTVTPDTLTPVPKSPGPPPSALGSHLPTSLPRCPPRVYLSPHGRRLSPHPQQAVLCTEASLPDAPGQGPSSSRGPASFYLT